MSIIEIDESINIPDGSPLSGPISKISAFDWLMLSCGLVSVVFHLYLVFSGLIPHLITRPIHFLLALPWIFLLAKTKSKWDRISGYFFTTVGFVAATYIAVNQSILVDQYGSIEGPLQYLVAISIILVTLEMARRAIRMVLPIFTLIVLIYGYFGDAIPGQFGHSGLPSVYFFGTLVIAEGGVWNSLTGTSAEIIAPFIILGSFISAGTAGTGFMTLATQIAGRFRAGAAKIAVLSSAMYGTISGIAAANTAATGMITIPAMKRLGYPPAMAAAVEAVASTGGQIMPPLMGVAVFVMAELLKMEYTKIMIAATPPAILFFIACWMGVHQYALRYQLRGLTKEQLPGRGTVARTAPFFFVPFSTLIYVLAFTSYTVSYAVLLALIPTVALLLIDSKGTIDVRRWFHRVWIAVIDAGRQIATIAAILICAGLVVGVFNMTGLGVKVTSLILSVSGDNLWIALILTGTASLVLGMELPTPAAYLICVAVAGPALVELGCPELYAHLFVLWYALLCTITPPVCGNVFIAAGIADTPWLPVAFHAMTIGIALFIVPLGFIANPSLLLIAKAPLLTLLAMIKVSCGLWLVSFAVIGPSKRSVFRLFAVVLGFIMIFGFGV